MYMYKYIYMYKYYRKIKNTFFSTNTSMSLRFLLQCIRIKYFAKKIYSNN